MAIKLITFEYREDDVLVNPDSVVLSDVTGTYGVKDADNAVIVAAGTAMVNDSVGIYTYLIPDVDLTIVHTYVVQFTIAGVVSHYVNQFGGGAAEPVDVGGRYATVAGMYARFGKVSIDKWASVNSDGEEDRLAAIKEAINYADDYVDGVLYGVYDVPFTTLKEGIPAIICNLCNQMAGVVLYEAQGVIDFNAESGEPQHRFQHTRKFVEKQLARIKAAHIALLNTTGVPLELKGDEVGASGPC